VGIKGSVFSSDINDSVISVISMSVISGLWDHWSLQTTPVVKSEIRFKIRVLTYLHIHVCIAYMFSASIDRLWGQIYSQIWNQWPQLPTYQCAYCLNGLGLFGGLKSHNRLQNWPQICNLWLKLHKKPCLFWEYLRLRKKEVELASTRPVLVRNSSKWAPIYRVMYCTIYNPPHSFWNNERHS